MIRRLLRRYRLRGTETWILVVPEPGHGYRSFGPEPRRYLLPVTARWTRVR